MNTKFLITLFILVVCTRAVQSTNRKTQRNFIYSIKSVVGRLCSDITTIKEKITDLEKGNDEQQEKINDLEIENDEQQEKISDLEIENDELQEKVRELDDLQIKVSDLEIENNELKLKVSDLEQSVSQTGKVAKRRLQRLIDRI